MLLHSTARFPTDTPYDLSFREPLQQSLRSEWLTMRIDSQNDFQIILQMMIKASVRMIVKIIVKMIIKMIVII